MPQLLMEQRVRYRKTDLASVIDVPIGVLVEIVTGKNTDLTYAADTAYRTLLETGIKVDGGAMYVAHRNAYISRLLFNTPWASGHNHILRHLPGATPSAQPMSFGHAQSQSRVIGIPLSS